MSSGVRTRLLEEQQRRAEAADREVRLRADQRRHRRAGVPFTEKLCLALLVVASLLVLAAGVSGFVYIGGDGAGGDSSGGGDLDVPRWLGVPARDRARAAAALVAAGVLLPVVWLACWVRCARMSRTKRSRIAFFADALLEEKIRGEGVRDCFDVEGDEFAENGTIVLLAGATAPRTLSRLISGRLARRFRVASVDVPGHGALQSVAFSLGGAQRMLSRVLEVLADEAPGAPPPMLSAFGSGAYVALHYAQNRPGDLSGLMLVGPHRDLEHTGCCGFTGFWSGLARLIWWSHLSDRRRRRKVLNAKGLDAALRRTAVSEDFNRAAWSDVVDACVGQPLLSALRELPSSSAVLVIGPQTFIERVRRLVPVTSVQVRVMASLTSTTIPPLREAELHSLMEAHIDHMHVVRRAMGFDVEDRNSSIRLVQ